MVEESPQGCAISMSSSSLRERLPARRVGPDPRLPRSEAADWWYWAARRSTSRCAFEPEAAGVAPGVEAGRVARGLGPGDAARPLGPRRAPAHLCARAADRAGGGRAGRPRRSLWFRSPRFVGMGRTRRRCTSSRSGSPRKDFKDEDGTSGPRDAVLRPLFHIVGKDGVPLACPLLVIDRVRGTEAGRAGCSRRATRSSPPQ